MHICYIYLYNSIRASLPLIATKFIKAGDINIMRKSFTCTTPKHCNLWETNSVSVRASDEIFLFKFAQFPLDGSLMYTYLTSNAP